MQPAQLLKILRVAEKLKCNTRHCVTSTGRPESVAEHSWRLALMAMLLTGEFPELDLNRVIRMCLIHDLGEAFTGDIPTFVKTDADSRREDDLFDRWIQTLPADVRGEWESLLEEMNAQKTGEAKLYKALDRLEAVIQHNESDIDSWLPLEYSLQLTYGAENVRFSPYLRELKQEIDQWTREKIAASEQKNQ
ncbi:MAG TPA: HD domain-containing protein [Candidatus Faecousia intestinavium]|nr:HD domain-containing protein [Candidatus Faecousia intestinavium]